MIAKDSSNNNFQLKLLNNPQLSTSVKKYGGGAAYFAPGNNGFKIPVSAQIANFGTGDFTIEWWEYLTTTSGNIGIIMYGGAGQSGGSDQPVIGLRYESGNLLRVGYNRGTDNDVWVDFNMSNFNPQDRLVTNQWVHCALVRYNGQLKFYRNGNPNFVAYSFSHNLPDATTINYPKDSTIGSFNSFSNGQYLDDLRITKGIARYTANFTPPQQQLPAPSDPYADNVSLLLHMDQNQFVDASLNGFTITPFGNARSSTQVVKYGDTAAYFGGSGDYLIVNSSSFLNFADNDFTIELWVRFDTVSNYQTIFNNSDGSIGLHISMDNGKLDVDNGASAQPPSSVVFTANQWYHVAVVRYNNNILGYVDGVQILNNSAQTYNSNNTFIVGRFTPQGGQTNDLNGYIDDLRITKGVARYTTTFTPPSAQLPTFTDPNFANVSLLLQTNRPFTDSSSNNFALSAFGDAQISTSVKKFGSGSGYFDGTGDYLEAVSNDAFNFGTGDFTVEAWIYLISTSSDYFITSSNGSGGLMFGFQFNTELGFGRAGVAWDYSAPSGIITGQWYHVAVSRSGTSIRLFVNGNQIGTTQTNSTSYNLGTGNLAIGAQNNNYFLNGYIDDLRITKGVARYTSNFVPHTAPFVNPPQIPSGYLAFWKLDDLTDSSPNENTLTNNGSVQFVAGKVGDCAEFALNKYLSTNINWNVVQNDWSVSFWMFPTSTPANVNTFPLVADNLAGTWLIQYLPSLQIGFSYTASPPLLGSAPLNTWTHVAATKSSAGLKLYINGILQGTSTYIGTLNPTIFRMNTEFNDQVYTGKLDAVGIWNRALTQSEIDILYNNGNGREP